MVDEQLGGLVCLIHAPVEIKRRAYHEAGHLVVGYALGLQVPEATIREEGDTEGWVYTYAPPEVLAYLIAAAGHDVVQRAVNRDEAARQAVLACKAELVARDPKAREVFAGNDWLMAVTTVAGPSAQYRGIRWGEWATRGGKFDYEWIETAFDLESRTKSEADKIRQELVDSANRILDMEWTAVRAFTKAFLEKTDLGPNQIGEIMARSFRPVSRDRVPVSVGHGREERPTLLHPGGEWQNDPVFRRLAR